MVYLANAFSLQMLTEVPATITVEEVKPQEIPNSIYSVIGHKDTAKVLSGILGFDVKMNREEIKLKKGDVLYVAQLIGGRLPEGVTTLPEGFSFEFFRVSV